MSEKDMQSCMQRCADRCLYSFIGPIARTAGTRSSRYFGLCNLIYHPKICRCARHLRDLRVLEFVRAEIRTVVLEHLSNWEGGGLHECLHVFIVCGIVML